MNRKLPSVISNFNTNITDLESNLSDYLEKTSEIGKLFGGPSIYFHKEAINEIKINFLEKRHIDMIYAMLPAWGMHRMGEETKTKIVNYEKFISQINKIKPKLFEYKNKHISEVSINELLILLTQLHVSISNSFLVSSSKVLHHILPNLFPPIDRQYSIRFMQQKKGYFNNSAIQLDYEYEYAEIFLTEMVKFLIKYEDLMKKHLNKVFNTSITKIFDNLLMVYVKNNRKI